MLSFQDACIMVASAIITAIGFWILIFFTLGILVCRGLNWMWNCFEDEPIGW